MSRPIKFRAWGLDGKWYYGDLVRRGPELFIVDYPEEWQVLHDTEGQFTGLTDKNGKEIYEGDIVKMTEEAKVGASQNLVVEYDEFGKAWLRPTDSRFYLDDLYAGCTDNIGNYKSKHGLAGEVIGNIHENKELLNV